MQAQSVLRRKAQAGRQNSGEVAEATPDKAISLAVTKAARETLGFEIKVSNPREQRLSLADLPEAIAEFSLLMLIEGPAEALGLMAVPPETLSAIIEMQTMGKLGRTAPAPRRPTRTDAAMAADFIDAVLTAIETELAGTDAGVWAGGFRYASCLDDVRLLEMLLEDLPYRAWTMDLGMNEGARRGGLLWVVPAQGRGKRMHLAEAREAAAPRGESRAEKEWAGQMEGTVNSAQASMDAVLHRVTLPLSTVMTLKPGTTIPLPADALTRLRLEGGGRFLSLARLGQHSGMRALRLIDEDPMQDGVVASARQASAIIAPPEAVAAAPAATATVAIAEAPKTLRVEPADEDDAGTKRAASA